MIAVRERVSAEVREGIDRTQVEVDLELRGGQRIHRRLEQVLGSLARPLSDQAMAAKVHDLADRMLGAAAVERLIDHCRRLDELDDVAVLVQAGVPG